MQVVQTLVSFPDSTLRKRKASGDIEAFSWSCAPSCDPIHVIPIITLLNLQNQAQRQCPQTLSMCAWWGLGTRLCKHRPFCWLLSDIDVLHVSRHCLNFLYPHTVQVCYDCLTEASNSQNWPFFWYVHMPFWYIISMLMMARAACNDYQACLHALVHNMYLATCVIDLHGCWGTSGVVSAAI